MDGTQSTIPTVDGTTTENGHIGNGAAVISYDITVNETITPNEIDKVLDSSSKTVTSNGTIVFYPKGNSVLISVTGCDGIIENNKLIVANVTKNTECKLVATKDITTLYNKILTDKNTISERTDFGTAYTTTNTRTLFKTTENNIIVYYFAGNTTNNWVKFANLYWRIIRTNHDGSIRLLYVGTSHDTTSGNIGESAFNTNSNSPKYVGYKYGEDTSLDTIRNNTTDSTIKTFIDSWYQNNLTNYTKYLSTSAVYCNDRSEGTGQTYSASSKFNFASYYRMDWDTDGAKANPSYNCTNIKDAFSVDNTSAKLDYPIALMTADEIAYAGGVAFQKMSTPYAWFISNSTGSQVSSNWWSLSPIYWNGSYTLVWDWSSGLADLDFHTATDALGVRPAISLKFCIKYSTGNGTYNEPYEIKETSSGC